MVWRVGRERVMLAAGPAALLLQLGHPLVAAGVADHSGFREDPLRRLRATLEAVLAISFGDADQVENAARRVARVHARVKGSLPASVGPFPAGTSYSAADPQLSLWVHATLVATALEAYAVLIGPLTSDEKDRYYEEAKPFARLFGVPDAVMPSDHAAFDDYFRSMATGPQLAVDTRARGLGNEVLHPPVPAMMRPAAAATRALTTGLLPASVRAAFGLRWRGRDRAAFRSLSRTVRATVRVLPPPVRYWPHYRVAQKRALGEDGAGN
jgi:uncharacterized protein (DUF2236 family)